MNFFDGVLTGGAGSDVGSFDGEGIAANGVRLVGRGKADGAAVKLGIRPQHLFLDPDGPLQGTATLVENLGTETVVELVTDSGVSFRFASPESLDIVRGQTAEFSFDAGDAHLF